MMTDPAASRPGTHLDPDRMADLLEGLLDAASADGARAHLASCPVCSADFALISGEGDPDELSGLGRLGRLGDLLPPVTIPQDVVTRIEAALYREPPLGTGSAAGADSGRGAEGAAAARPRRRGFRVTLGALAGATLVAAGGFGIVTALDHGSSTSKSDSSTAAAGSAPSSQSTDGSRLAGPAPNAQQMSPQVGGVPANPSSISDANGLTIEQQAQALLSQRLMNPSSATPGGECEPAGMATAAKPLTGAQTRYQGKTVWLLIYPASGNPAVADVFVVDANGCSPDNPGQVLDKFEIARG